MTISIVINQLLTCLEEFYREYSTSVKKNEEN